MFSKHSKFQMPANFEWKLRQMPFFGQLSFDPLCIVQCEPFNSARGFDLEVTDGAMRSKKGKQGVKRRANWSLLGQNCAEPRENWYILYIFIHLSKTLFKA